MTNLYAESRLVTDPAECHWYHAMELPDLGLVGGDWDLRPTIDAYLGGVDVQGKRCLDIGSASGYLSFEMERQGASEVVSVDLDPNAGEWDMVPYAVPPVFRERWRARAHADLARVQNGYWLAHRLLGSQARVYYGNAYHLPAELGRFDVVVIGMMLPHVRDPLRVLEQAAERSSDTIIVTQQAPGMTDAYAYFMPSIEHLDPQAWWSLSAACTERMLAILGFRVVETITAEHTSPYRGRSEACTALVARK